MTFMKLLLSSQRICHKTNITFNINWILYVIKCMSNGTVHACSVLLKSQMDECNTDFDCDNTSEDML